MNTIYVCGHCGADVEEDDLCGCYRDLLAKVLMLPEITKLEYRQGVARGTFTDPLELAWTEDFVGLVRSEVYGG